MTNIDTTRTPNNPYRGRTVLCIIALGIFISCLGVGRDISGQSWEDRTRGVGAGISAEGVYFEVGWRSISVPFTTEGTSCFGFLIHFYFTGQWGVRSPMPDRWLRVQIPWWFILALVFGPALDRWGARYALDQRIRREMFTSGTQCMNCGYDLRATPDRCPECGEVPLRRIRRR